MTSIMTSFQDLTCVGRSRFFAQASVQRTSWPATGRTQHTAFLPLLEQDDLKSGLLLAEDAKSTLDG